ncbi:sensor histidine kinase [Cohnella luojiensis]|uniref:histidine kinase n=1 Tax=Cohnella luojiensis TaxID=652876 RepID=A0A4Y8LNB3_9BACL|nr:HAMP domain-containing sensor histidine kinase [Cohnella luojiensis]TFE19591.1 HAMP domain-containing histidine kinase [Cohnella luojiensis]
MKSVYWLTALKFLAIIISLFAFYPLPANAAASHPIQIREWQVMWIEKEDLSDKVPSIDGKWEEFSADKPETVVPEGASGMWVHLIVPPTADWQRPGMLADRLYGLELSVYQGNRLVFESRRDFGFDLNKLLLPIGQFSEPQDFYIRIITTSDRAGLISAIRIDDFETLSHRFVNKELPDLLLGTSIAFLALIMFICSGYLQRRQRRSWISLCLIALTTGTLIIVYCPLTYIYLKEYGDVLLLLFDVSLFVLFPSLNYYIDQVFDGQFRFFTKFRNFQAGYSAVCLVGLFIYATSIHRYYDLFYLLSNVIMGVLILTQLLLIIVLSILNALKGNKDSVILSGGILSLALSGTVDLTLYYLSDKRYVLFLWKLGVVIMIVTLVIILARRISADYAKLVTYSKELELYNRSLQRTEKMKIISDLAASVAHEVRNPLQVTRGFLQLLAGRTDEKSKPYFDLAVNELDRASDIITDFLTFAKPEMDKIALLNLSKEIRKIEAMMIPLAAMHGGVLVCHTQENLYFHGNSSKLKQALINIIKNSIEAIGKEGLIEIKAASEEGDAVIRISDNGEGMDEEQIVNLGVPYFSTKTKGTGLGMMVTFRIIEVMKGTIKIHSTKGKGTEFLIRFPLVVKDKVLPDDVGA